MDTDDDEFFRKAFFQVAQLRDVVQTVDSAERPELEQDDLAAQFFEGERAGGIEPYQARNEFRRVNFAAQIGHGILLSLTVK